MELTRLGHAALLVETTRSRILIDPGTFSALWHDLTELDAILVTHQHADHVDVEHMPGLLAANPRARVLVEPAVAGMLPDHETEPARAGDSVTVGDLVVEIVGGEHALIHESIPRIGNVGYVIAEGDGPRVFHPGDSYATMPAGIDLLALPITAPWSKVGDAIDFLDSVAPARAIPIHDAIVSDKGRPIYMRMCSSQTSSGASLDDPAVGEPYRL